MILSSLHLTLSMVSLEVLAILLSGISISASLFYYANVLRNADETRKTQLLTNIMSQMNEPDFWDTYSKLIREYEWKDFEEYQQKYGVSSNPEVNKRLLALMAFYNAIGVLVSTDKIDIELVGMHIGDMVIEAWNKMESVIIEARKSNPRSYCYFEYLKDERLKQDRKVLGKASYLNEKLLTSNK